MFDRGSQWRKWDLHLHTASSYDAKYKGADADSLLCKSLHDNDISAAVITDHFKIDAERIANLRALAPDIVFFPGVELRTDKGANNLHVILIFSNMSNLAELSADFDAIMLRSKAKSSKSDDTIYWDYQDILEFAKEHNALVSIHAGKKSNGLDKEIENGDVFKEAVKEEIGNSVHFFEIGNTKKDIESYQKYVFKVIKEKPLVMGSDCHDPRDYSPKEFCWIKADLTFDGLKQCVYQPEERVYIGAVPPTVDREKKNKTAIIDSVAVHKKANAKNDAANWFDCDIALNSSMVAIIGNKGSGKSALSDIIGHLCKCRTMDHASFLTDARFRKAPKNYAADYEATIQWSDGKSETCTLDRIKYDTSMEEAQYLPQRFIEEVCNDFDSFFQDEIDKVIFSYVDKTERGSATNLNELVKNKSQSIYIESEGLRSQLRAIIGKIIGLEKKLTKDYKKSVVDGLKQKEELLIRHDKSKPEEVKKPEKNEDKKYIETLEKINGEIEEISTTIDKRESRLIELNDEITEINNLLARIRSLETSVEAINDAIAELVNKYTLKDITEVSFNTPLEAFEDLLERLEIEKGEIKENLDGDDGLKAQKESKKKKKEALISTTNAAEKKYQKYLSDLAEWTQQRNEIVGDEDSEGTIQFFKKELDYINNTLNADYLEAKEKRKELFYQLFNLNKKVISVLEAIYSPIEKEIEDLLGNLEDNVEFQAEIQLTDRSFSETVLKNINQRMTGIFKGKSEAVVILDKYVKQTEFNNPDSVYSLVQNIMVAVDEDLNSSEKKIADKNELYEYLFGLEYVDVLFKLKMAGRSLEELSPGERGIVLLVFYLALNKNNAPIIIDQPEDNLDNQSVYSKLVPCICKAKQHRQVIIVTHNPNIAVACDAEQIIFCDMDKSSYQQLSYISGSIENEDMRKHVVDVLEGTMPAFDLRRQKYDEPWKDDEVI